MSNYTPYNSAIASSVYMTWTHEQAEKSRRKKEAEEFLAKISHLLPQPMFPEWGLPYLDLEFTIGMKNGQTE